MGALALTDELLEALRTAEKDDIVMVNGMLTIKRRRDVDIKSSGCSKL